MISYFKKDRDIYTDLKELINERNNKIRRLLIKIRKLEDDNKMLNDYINKYINKNGK